MSEKTPEQIKKELFYDPFPDCPDDGCEVCDNQVCDMREEEAQQCDYTGEECIDENCRLMCGCVGCEMLAPPEEHTPVCPHCDIEMEPDGELNDAPAFTCKKCKRVVQCTREYILKLWEDLCGPKPLGLIGSVNEKDAVKIISNQPEGEKKA